jgi:hypothetical protein
VDQNGLIRIKGIGEYGSRFFESFTRVGPLRRSQQISKQNILYKLRKMPNSNYNSATT